MKKKFIALVASLIFIHHVICTILYNAPLNPLSNTYQRYVASYMEPLFAQKWLLFAPEPATSDLKLWYRVKYNNKWSTWLDPLEPVLRKHQHIRFTYNAKLLYVYGNIAKDLNYKNSLLATKYPYVKKDDKVFKKLNDSLTASSEFKLAKRYVKRDLGKSFRNIKVDSLQMMVIQLYPKQFSERLTNKPFGFANSVEFSPVAFSENE